ncbi:MAG: heavy metal translocating P-type ATPase [Endomicrobium sp.]|jgi:Cu2+-exporting ATPase/Cu+-exporting ATPase|nr:heavy metal translocating P-type ATPase [Endomicrobium sp.]
MEKKTFIVTGMTCAACSSRVERAVSKMDGVKKADVNLLKNTLTVSFDGSVTGIKQIIEKVENAGYGAAFQNANVKKNNNLSGDGASREIFLIKKRLIISVIFAVPLFYLSMGEMLGLPLPPFLTGMQNMAVFAFTQFLLSLPVIFVNRKYFQTGFKNLVKLSPNMDSLIALGSGAAFVYGAYAVYKVAYGMGIGDMDLVHKFGMDLYFESAAMILTFITLGRFFEAQAKRKTSEAITKLMKLTPETALVIRSGKEETAPVEEIIVGDILIVKAGDSVCVDGIIEEGYGSIDESAVTGESLPVDKTVGDKITAGTVNKSGYFKMRAAAVGGDTALAKIIRLVDDATSSKAPIAKLADKISYIFVPAVIFTALSAALIWLFGGQSFEFALSAGISVLVISCPCALGLAAPTAIMVGIGRGASKSILIKSADALETARAIDTVVLDKTGTITEGIPVVTDIVPVGVSHDELLSAAVSIEKMSGHPLASAIIKKAKQSGTEIKSVKDYKFMPGRGVSGIIDSITYFGGNRKMAEEVGVNTEKIADIEKKFAAEGKRILYFSKYKTLIGIIVLADTLKKESATAVKRLKQTGLEVIMLTGDNVKTAEYIGRQAGIDKVISEVLPEDKEREIRLLQESGKKVAMVGDGINDAPALAKADVGIAIGAGTDIAIESADIVLMKNSLNDVAAAIKLSRAVVRNIKQNLFWAFVYNIIGIPVAAGILYGSHGILLNPMIAAAAMSFSSVSVVFNALRLKFFNTDEKGISMKKVIKIEGMSCGHCSAAVTKALKSLDGINAVEVNLKTKEATVGVSEAVSDEKLRNAVEEAGYKVVEIN